MFGLFGGTTATSTSKNSCSAPPTTTAVPVMPHSDLYRLTSDCTVMLSSTSPESLTGTASFASTAACRPSGQRCSLAIRSARSEEHTSELQSQSNLVCRLLLEKTK